MRCELVLAWAWAFFGGCGVEGSEPTAVPEPDLGELVLEETFELLPSFDRWRFQPERVYLEMDLGNAVPSLGFWPYSGESLLELVNAIPFGNQSLAVSFETAGFVREPPQQGSGLNVFLDLYDSTNQFSSKIGLRLVYNLEDNDPYLGYPKGKLVFLSCTNGQFPVAQPFENDSLHRVQLRIDAQGMHGAIDGNELCHDTSVVQVNGSVRLRFSVHQNNFSGYEFAVIDNVRLHRGTL